jgi:predicted N-acetyltransferase YhbS
MPYPMHPRAGPGPDLLDETDCGQDDPVRVRTLAEGDLDAVVRVDAAAMGRPRPEYYRGKLEAALRESRLVTSLVAEVDERVVGFVLAQVHYGEFGQAEAVAVVDSVGVDPEYRRRRVGRSLVRQLLANLRALGVERVQTQVDWPQTDLSGFLAAQGFQPAPRVCLERRL